MAHLKQNKKLNLRYLIRMKQLAVIIAQLAERSLPTPEFRSSNPLCRLMNLFIGKFLHSAFTYCYIEKKKKKKEAGNGLFKQK